MDVIFFCAKLFLNIFNHILQDLLAYFSSDLHDLLQIALFFPIICKTS